LTGTVGKETKEFVYELTFPEKTGDEKGFVEQVWARRKVGFLLDQIRANGEKAELVSETVALAKKYGITTPYTSWLIVPDAVVPVVRLGRDKQPPVGGPARPFALAPTDGDEAKGDKPVTKFLEEQSARATTSLDTIRGDIAERELTKNKDVEKKEAEKRDPKAPISSGGATSSAPSAEALDKKTAFDDARKALGGKGADGLQAVQAGKLGVDLSVQVQNLRNQNRLEKTASRNVQGRNCLDIGGVWIDEGYEAKMARVVVKAQSDAYFRILERHAVVKDVYVLGNHLAWITPSGVVLIVDSNDGKDKLSDEEIDKLFVAKK